MASVLNPILVGALVFSLAACSTSMSVQPEYPVYERAEDLELAADVVAEVIIGKAEAGVLLPDYSSEDPRVNPYAGTDETPSLDEGALPITIFEARVVRVFKGDLKSGESINIKEIGGELDGQTIVNSEVETLRGKEKVLVFLAEFEGAAYSILGGDAGLFEPQGADEFAPAGKNGSFHLRALDDRLIEEDSR